MCLWIVLVYCHNASENAWIYLVAMLNADVGRNELGKPCSINRVDVCVVDDEWWREYDWVSPMSTSSEKHG
jgi:hypothetical protein